MSALSRTRTFHQSNAVLVEVPLANGDTVPVEVTVWRTVSNPSLLYVSTRPQGGSWRTLNTALDMSALSRTRTFHQSNVVLVEVPLPEPVPEPAGEEESPERVCRWQETAAHVVASTVKVTTPTVTGSAFYVGNGQFVTAGHVVEDRPSRITLSNEHVFLTARLVGFYNFDNGDVALLAASAASLTALEWAGTLTIGSDIAIAGYPEALGTTASWTRGTVSRLFMAGGISYIQTDAASSPGNSGGPLVDACGRVAGVVSSSYIGERGSEGLHFAVAEPTLGQKLVALGLRGHVVAEGGSMPEGAEEIAAGPRRVQYGGEVYFQTQRLNAPYGGFGPPPAGTTISALVGGEVCDTFTTTSPRYGKVRYSLSVEEGCGGAEPGVPVTFTVGGALRAAYPEATRWEWGWGLAAGNIDSPMRIYWGESHHLLAIYVRITLPPAPPPRADAAEVAAYVGRVNEVWNEALGNIDAGSIWRIPPPTWATPAWGGTTWAEVVVEELEDLPSVWVGVGVRNDALVKMWREKAVAYWTAVDAYHRKWAGNDSAQEFYRERAMAAWEAYTPVRCDLWQREGYDNAKEVCPAAVPPTWEEIDSLSDRVLEHWDPTLTANSVLISQWNAVIDTAELPSNRLAGIARQQITIVQSMLDRLILLRSDTATRNTIASSHLEAAISYWTAALKGVEAYEAYALTQVGWADVETANATTATAFSEFRNAECALFQLQEYSTAEEVCAAAGQ